jgi:predicted esterase
MPEQAQAAMILLHGRGASPEDILGIAAQIEVEPVTYLAPAAMGSQWYPQTFLAPQSANQPWLGSALRRVDALVQHLINANIATERIVLLGFSQGACLATEYVARNPKRYGGLAALSGGLIGTDADLVGYNGSFDGMPALLGCSDIDPHIPLARVQKSTEQLRSMAATVDERIYPDMGHYVNEDELNAVRIMLEGILAE